MNALRYASASLAACLLLAPGLASAQSPPPIPPPAAPQLPPPPLAPVVQYYYDDNGKPSGPVTLEEIRRKVASGEIKPDTLVWKAGMPAWLAAKALPELTASNVPRPSPPAAPQPPPGAPKPAAPAPVAAQDGCAGSRVYMSDNFAQAPVNGPSYSVEEGKLKGKAQPTNSEWFLYGRVLHLDNYEACVTAQLPNKFQNPAASVAALIFAAANVDDIYYLAVAPNGQASIQHNHDKKVDYPIEWKDFDAIKLEPPGKNVLRVVVRGASATAYINGQKLGTADIQPPAGGTHVGLFFHSEQTQRDTWKFIDLKVTDAP